MWGITIGGTILQNELSSKLPADFLSQFPGGAEIAFSVIPAIPTLSEPLKHDVQVIFATGISRIWQVMAGVSASGFVVALLMKGLPLHTEVDEKWGLSEQKPEESKAQKTQSIIIDGKLKFQPMRLQVKLAHEGESEALRSPIRVSVVATCTTP